MRDTDWLWNPETGSPLSMQIHTEEQKHRLGFDLRSRKEKENERRRIKYAQSKKR